MAYTFFLSYTHTKNEDGRVTLFFNHLLTEIKNITGKESTAFMDIHEILGGDEWEIKITKSLEDASILLILLSTAWLKSDSCIKEYNTFRRFNDDKGRHIIPLQWRYIYPQELTTENDKQIMAQMESLQIIDWIKLSNNNDYQSSTTLKQNIADLADLMKRKILGIS